MVAKFAAFLASCYSVETLKYVTFMMWERTSYIIMGAAMGSNCMSPYVIHNYIVTEMLPADTQLM